MEFTSVPFKNMSWVLALSFWMMAAGCTYTHARAQQASKQGPTHELVEYAPRESAKPRDADTCHAWQASPEQVPSSAGSLPAEGLWFDAIWC